MAFPDDLPPAELELFPKLLIYLGIFYILLTAITTWLITRRRSFPKPVEVPAEPREQPQQTVVQTASGITEAMSFTDTKDKLSSLKVEIMGAEASLSSLNELQEEMNPEIYQELSARYSERVAELQQQMNEMLQADIQTGSGEIDSGVSDDEMESIEADLEKQLMDLDNDDFLVTRPKRNIDEIFDEGSQTKQETPPQSTPATPAAEPAKVSMPPTPNQKASAPPSPASSTPAQPAEQKKVPMPPPPSQKASAPPPPSSSGQQNKVPMPPPPSQKAASPPPPSSSGASAATPPATKAQPPASKKPLSAAQPMKVQSEDDDGMFAKSTSIAALRMDMLRELARLKKLIPEDQDKDQ